MNKNVFLLALVILATAFTANAQVLNKNTTFKIGGLGRSVLTSDKISGDRLNGDTLSANKGLGGYTLFDLNTDLTVNQIFNANVIMRIKNPYGSFYGQDTYFEFRQLQFNGRIGRSLRYEVGDIYVGLTPYTVHNANEPLDNKYEADGIGPGVLAVEPKRLNISTTLTFNRDGKKVAQKWFLMVAVWRLPMLNAVQLW